MELKDRLKKARKSVNLTQVDVAKSIKGLTQPSYSGLERGESKSTSKIAELAQLFNVNPLWLATGEGEMNPNVQNTLISELPQISNNDEELETPMHILKKLLNSDESFLIERYRSLPTDKKHALINFIGDNKDNTEPNNKTINNSVVNSPHSKNEFNNSIS